jgi:Carboxypeptidase regulatory-like domain
VLQAEELFASMPESALWKDVKLSLVAGAPQSFVQRISTPDYARRPVVGLPETAQLAPQTHEGTVDSPEDIETGTLAGSDRSKLKYMAPPPPPPPSSLPVQGRAIGGIVKAGCSVRGNITDPTGAAVSNANITLTSFADGSSRNAYTDGMGNYCMNGISPGKWRFRAEAPGFNPFIVSNVSIRPSGNRMNAQLHAGSTAETVEVSGEEFNAPTSTMNSVMEEQFESASGREIGELFSYDIKLPITIGKDQSALVPIVQARVEALKVTIWNGSEVPRNALWLRNTSGATLDSGSFSIVEGDSFAGEGLLDPIKPNERRLLSYAGEPAIRVESENESAEQPVSHVRIVRGLMTITRQGRSKQIYTIHNSDKGSAQRRHRTSGARRMEVRRGPKARGDLRIPSPIPGESRTKCVRQARNP